MPGILWAVLQEPIAILPKFLCGSPHHITLHYGCERDVYAEIIGLPMTAAVMEEAYNDRIQAIRVVLPVWVPCQILHPHISVSWTEDAAPVIANEMLAGEHFTSKLEFDRVLTTIEFYEFQ